MGQHRERETEGTVLGILAPMVFSERLRRVARFIYTHRFISTDFLAYMETPSTD